MKHATLALLPIFLGACTYYVPPPEMSVEAHEAVATAADSSARANVEQVLTEAPSKPTPCDGSTAPCWTVTESSATRQLEEAQALHRIANEHREVAVALHDAEASACGGVAAGDRDISPLTRREDITSTGRLMGRTVAKSPTDEPRGAFVTIRAVRGLTRQYLQRVLECHLARNASMGYGVHRGDPQAIQGASVAVDSLGDGFRIELSSDDWDTAREIMRRTLALPRT
jgi:hypothetical protein